MRWLVVALALLGQAPAAELLGALEPGIVDSCGDTGCCDDECGSGGCCAVAGACGCCATTPGVLQGPPRFVIAAPPPVQHLATTDRAPPAPGARPHLPPPRLG